MTRCISAGQRLNKLEDKIEQLEDKIEQLESQRDALLSALERVAKWHEEYRGSDSTAFPIDLVMAAISAVKEGK